MGQKENLVATVLFCFLLLPQVIPVVSAQNATFSTLGLLGAEDILIYTFNGTDQTLYGMYNTSSQVVPLPAGDFNIIVRPSTQGRFTPALFLTDSFAYIESNAIPILILVFLIGLLLRKS
jgi:hypothetical protein